MRRRLTCVFLCLTAGLATAANPTSLLNRRSIPLTFEPNVGQTDARVKFLSRGAGYRVFLLPQQAVIVLSPASGREPATVVKMSMLGANPNPRISGTGELPTRVNYLIGSDRKRWRRNVPVYSQVTYKDVYAGVDLLYYGTEGRLEYDFVLDPGADPNRIQLTFGGADKLAINAGGDVIVTVGRSELRLKRPLAYQQLGGARRLVAAKYELRNRQIRFRVGIYDKRHALIIDPVLSYATYLGGTGTSRHETAEAIAVDPVGNVYVAGFTSSDDFPTTSGSIQGFYGGGSDAFVTKLDPKGVVVYSTYLGGSGFDAVNAIAADSAGHAYIGSSISFLAATPGAFLTSPPQGGSSFVAKMTPDGSGFVYATFFPGAVNAIAVQGENAYLAGGANASGFFTTPGAFQGSSAGDVDAFVSKLSVTGGSVEYSTLLGGSGYDQALGIAVDAAGSAYVAGLTRSANFPVSSPAVQLNLVGVQSGFVAKFNPSGSALSYSTFLGGSSRGDSAHAVAVDVSGNAHVTGATSSPAFPVTANAFQKQYKSTSGFNNAFVSKLNADGSQWIYSTYLGGEFNDVASSIGVDPAGLATVAGQTSSATFPTTADAIKTTLLDGGDAFISTLSRDGSALVFSTYLGGLGSDLATALAVDAAGIYVAGFTDAPDFPVKNAAQPVLRGPTDTFVAKIGADLFAPVLALPSDILTDATSPAGTVIQFSATATDDHDLNPSVTCNRPSGSTFPIGVRIVTCTATDATGNPASASFKVRVKSAAQQVPDLIVFVRSLNLSQGLWVRLNAKLRLVQQGLRSGDIPTACTQLSAFISQAQAQRGRGLTAQQSDDLISEAQRIGAVLGCP